MMMRDTDTQERRNREILADVVRAYIETGEPISSRAISKRLMERLSPATIRNVMVDLEEAGYLSQPHTSAGRVPTAAAYRIFAQMVASQARLTPEDEQWIRNEMSAARGSEEIAERAGRVLARISRGLGIVVAPPIGKAVVEHLRFVLLPDLRVLAIVIGPGGTTRDKVLHTQRHFVQEELDRTSDYLNRHYSGWTLAAIREDLLANLAKDHERYDDLTATALTLCDPQLLADTTTRQVLVEGTAQMAATPEFSGQGQFQELLFAIEEKHKLVALLNNCIDSPEPVLVQIGLGEIATDGSNLALISAPYTAHDQVQGSLGVLGPTRMQYERAITAVAYVARLYSGTLDRS